MHVCSCKLKLMYLYSMLFLPLCIVIQFHSFHFESKLSEAPFWLAMASPLTDLPCCMSFSCREETQLSSVQDQHQESVQQTLDMHMNEIAALTEKNRWLVTKSLYLPNHYFYRSLLPLLILSDLNFSLLCISSKKLAFIYSFFFLPLNFS